MITPFSSKRWINRSLVAMLIGVLLAAGAVAVARAHEGDTTTIQACVTPMSGQIRIVGADDTCRPNEVPLQ